MRSYLRMMLVGAANLGVVAEAADGSEVLGARDLHRPDVVLMDIRMPQLDGIATTRLLAAPSDAPTVLVLTTSDADELVLRAVLAGAGFLLNDTPPAESRARPLSGRSLLGTPPTGWSARTPARLTMSYGNRCPTAGNRARASAGHADGSSSTCATARQTSSVIRGRSVRGAHKGSSERTTVR